jgi:hypothetical protein
VRPLAEVLRFEHVECRVPTAAASGLPPNVLPWSPGANCAITSSRAQNALTGSRPPPSALPRVRPSGRTPSWSQASTRPVRPRPVCTSSAIISTSCACRSRAPREVAGRRHDDPGLALDRLDQERGGVRRDRRSSAAASPYGTLTNPGANGPKPSRYCASLEKPTIVVVRPAKLPAATMICACPSGTRLTL